MTRWGKGLVATAAGAALMLTGLAAGAPKSEPPLHKAEVVSRGDGKNGPLPNEGGIMDATTAGGLSADGRYALFTSVADNLSSDDADDTRDVFVRDLKLGKTILISRETGAGDTDPGDDDSSDPAISADGNCVAFLSQANNLGIVDDNDVTNVFLRNIETRTTTVISVDPDTIGGADDNSAEPDVSDDCRRVAFGSNATNLSDDDVVVQDVFLRDLDASETILVSRETGSPGDAADGASFSPSISGDGSVVVFHSTGENLVADAGEFQNTFVRNLETNETALVNRTSGGVAGDGLSGEGEISRDGRYVIFGSNADNLSGDDVAFGDVFVRDLDLGTTTLVSRRNGLAAGNGGDAPAFASGISGDGRFALFGSTAENLSGDDTATTDVFVRDLVANRTILLSRRSGSGAAGDNSSYAIGIADGGRYATFTSDATNLGGGADGIRDAYRREVFEVCAGQAATLTGTNGRDTLRGTTGADVIVVLGGKDVVNGRGGKDLVCGGPGPDTLKGSGGKDTLLGEGANDKLRGGPAKDKLRGGQGRDDIVQ